MTDLDLLDAQPSDFFAPVSTDSITSMVAQYNAVRARIEQIAPAGTSVSVVMLVASK